MGRNIAMAGLLAVAIALATGGSAPAAGNSSVPRCITDQAGTETCRYPDGTTTRRSTDRAGVVTFRDRDGVVTREKPEYGAKAAVMDVRGKTVARCRDDGRGNALCRR